MLLRGDMDALPVTEEVDVPYRSEVDGTMHACGHDTHVAILMAVADVLSRRRGTQRADPPLCLAVRSSLPRLLIMKLTPFAKLFITLIILGVVLVAALYVFFSSLYVVNEREQALGFDLLLAMERGHLGALHAAIDGMKRLTGRIVGVEGDHVVLELLAPHELPEAQKALPRSPSKRTTRKVASAARSPARTAPART